MNYHHVSSGTVKKKSGTDRMAIAIENYIADRSKGGDSNLFPN
jgi:hypothetical protein